MKTSIFDTVDEVVEAFALEDVIQEDEFGGGLFAGESKGRGERGGRGVEFEDPGAVAEGEGLH